MLKLLKTDKKNGRTTAKQIKVLKKMKK